MDAPLAVAGMFKFQFHQVAIYTPDVARSVYQFEELGYRGWTYDTARLVGTLEGEKVETFATMAFNYEVMPMELEFLHYRGPSRHAVRASHTRLPFISHMSVHVDNTDEMVDRIFNETGMVPFHRFETFDHTNPHVAGKKRFKEAIYDTTRALGYDLKMIERIPW